MQPNIWDYMTKAMAQLKPMEWEQSDSEALDSDDEGDDDEVVATSEPTEEQLVEYEGMLVSASAAQRRQCVASIPCTATQLIQSRGADPSREISLHNDCTDWKPVCTAGCRAIST